MKLAERQENALAWALKASELTRNFGSYQAGQLNNLRCHTILNVAAQKLGFVKKGNRTHFEWVGPAAPNILVGRKLVEASSKYWRDKDFRKKTKKANGAIPVSPISRLQKIESRISSLEDCIPSAATSARLDTIEQAINHIIKELK